MPPAKYGASRETLWRVLCPITSRWRNVGLQEAVFGSKRAITEAEWLRFLDSDAKAELDPASIRKAVDAVQEKVAPSSEAIECQQRRSETSQRLKYGPQRRATAETVLLTGDIVIYKNSCLW